jgi:hypothetical protein
MAQDDLTNLIGSRSEKVISLHSQSKARDGLPA